DPRTGRTGVAVAIEVEMLTVGALAENCFLARAEGSDKLVVVDPGDEADLILAKAAEMGAEIEAILLTHTHFDHVGAVAALARETGAPVYCPEIEVPVLADISSYIMPGFPELESYQTDRTVAGGETLTLGGLELDVVFTPGHSPGHVTYSARGEDAIFSG